MVAAVALKVVLVALELTVTDAGTVRMELLLDRVTVVPPAGAAWVSAMVHKAEAFDTRLDGVQTNDETRTVAARLTFVVAELLL
jgi:hypothetical protein